MTDTAVSFSDIGKRYRRRSFSGLGGDHVKVGDSGADDLDRKPKGVDSLFRLLLLPGRHRIADLEGGLKLGVMARRSDWFSCSRS